MTTTLDTVIHLIAGGCGGTLGAVMTSPFEVVKTRLQSSQSHGLSVPKGAPAPSEPPPPPPPTSATSSTSQSTSSPPSRSLSSCSASSTSYSSSSTSTTTTTRRYPFQLKPGFSYFDPSVSPVRASYFSSSSVLSSTAAVPQQAVLLDTNPFRCIKLIVQHEGLWSLYRGLGPTVCGVAPARAIYFWAYETAKNNLNLQLPKRNRDSPLVHMLSAMCAGFSASTCTNPLWLVKTRLQLDRKTGNSTLTVKACIFRIYRERGIFGYWKGVTASYYGVSETMIHFVIYEHLKRNVIFDRNSSSDNFFINVLRFMGCGACSRFVATLCTYPHEVARTRLREEGDKFRSFWQTLGLVRREDGWAGLYRGLTTQLVRQIPNSAVVMATYEVVVLLLTKWLKPQQQA